MARGIFYTSECKALWGDSEEAPFFASGPSLICSFTGHSASVVSMHPE